MKRDFMKKVNRPLTAEREKRPQMKKRNMLPAIALMAATTFGGAFSAQAFAGSFEDCGLPPHKRVDNDKQFNRMAEELKLNNSQREQIKGILKAEKDQSEPVQKKLMDNRKLLQQAIEAENFDEAAIKELAATQAGLQTELMVSRARLHNRINAVLTAEQRELAKKFHSMDGRKGNRKQGK